MRDDGVETSIEATLYTVYSAVYWMPSHPLQQQTLQTTKTKEREVRRTGEKSEDGEKRPQAEVVLVPGAIGGGREASLK